MDEGFPDFSFAFAHGGTTAIASNKSSTHQHNTYSQSSTSSSPTSSSSSISTNISWDSSWGNAVARPVEPSPNAFDRAFTVKPAVVPTHKHNSSSMNIQWTPWKTPARPNKLLDPKTFSLQPIEGATIAQRRSHRRAPPSIGLV